MKISICRSAAGLAEEAWTESDMAQVAQDLQSAIKAAGGSANLLGLGKQGFSLDTDTGTKNKVTYDAKTGSLTVTRLGISSADDVRDAVLSMIA